MRLSASANHFHLIVHPTGCVSLTDSGFAPNTASRAARK
jgi:hypothetical protein